MAPNFDELDAWLRAASHPVLRSLHRARFVSFWAPMSDVTLRAVYLWVNHDRAPGRPLIEQKTLEALSAGVFDDVVARVARGDLQTGDRAAVRPFVVRAHVEHVVALYRNRTFDGPRDSPAGCAACLSRFLKQGAPASGSPLAWAIEVPDDACQEDHLAKYPLLNLQSARLISAAEPDDAAQGTVADILEQAKRLTFGPSTSWPSLVAPLIIPTFVLFNSLLRGQFQTFPGRWGESPDFAVNDGDFAAPISSSPSPPPPPVPPTRLAPGQTSTQAGGGGKGADAVSPPSGGRPGGGSGDARGDNHPGGAPGEPGGELPGIAGGSRPGGGGDESGGRELPGVGGGARPGSGDDRPGGELPGVGAGTRPGGGGDATGPGGRTGSRGAMTVGTVSVNDARMAVLLGRAGSRTRCTVRVETGTYTIAFGSSAIVGPFPASADERTLIVGNVLSAALASPNCGAGQ